MVSTGITIGDFSRLTRVPAKTLRFYDEIGLFKPARVDSWTGYRYYLPEQLPRLNRILALKALGLSLEQIKQILDDDLSADEMRGMLRLKRAELEQRVRDDQLQLAYVEAKIKQIEQEGTLISDYEVVLKSVPALTAASLRGTCPSRADFGPTFGRLFERVMDWIRVQNGRPLMSIALLHDEEMPEADIAVEAAVTLEAPIPAAADVQIVTLAEIPTAACVLYRGSYDAIEPAYERVLHWIGANGYRITAASREVYLHFERGTPEHHLTEIQFPVGKVM
ncbi:MAG: MerR family transcriptional regulator [Anaerolineae bacterium]